MKSINLDYIEEIAKMNYRTVPYHNFNHALEVKNNSEKIFDYIIENNKSLAELLLKDYKKYTVAELREVLQIAALFHDAGHLYKSTMDDEKISAELVEKILKKFEYPNQKIEYVKWLILDTIFRNRRNIRTVLWKILADADIALSLWGTYDEFISNDLSLALETMPQNVPLSKEFIINSIKWKKGFVNYLTSITKKPDSPFLLDETSKLFPTFKENFSKLQKEIDNNEYENWIKLTEKIWEETYWFAPIFVEDIQ